MDGVSIMIYFDNSATTMPYDEVLDSFMKVSKDYFGNPSSLHGIGAMAEKLLTQARQQVAQLLEVYENEIYFTSGGTEGNNLAIKGVAFAHQNRGKHIIISSIEHASVKQTCEQLAELGFEITILPVNKDGRVEVSSVEEAIKEETILVSVMHVNNETGAIQPIEEIGSLLKNHSKILFHVDFVQGVGKVDLNIKKCGIDLCTISAHKFHGLKGNGILFIREGVKMFPLFTGGSQERKLRSGTENVAGAVSTAKALRMIFQKKKHDMKNLLEVSRFLKEELMKIPGVVVNTPEENCAPHIVNFSVPGVKSEVLVHALEEKGIYVSTTSACSSKKKSISSTVFAMTGREDLAESTIRMSLSYQNTLEEAQTVIKELIAALKRLKEVMKS